MQMAQPSSAAAAAIDTTKSLVPNHLAIILDGNRRWAKERGLPPFEGHRVGYENLKTIGDAVLKRGVKYLTVFVFSTENWQRPKLEVSFLMDLFYRIATKEVEEMNRRNTKLRFIGSEAGLPAKLLKAMAQAAESTKDNTGGTLALCLNYGGQQEIVEATRQMAVEGIKPEDITTDTISQHLYAPDIPPVDLVIRTSGEQRVSGFMLWRMAYAELKFVDTYWPAFTEAQLDECLADYASRQRRFGK